MYPMCGFTHKGLRVQPSPHGFGVFADERIPEGTMLVNFGGQLVDEDGVGKLGLTRAGGYLIRLKNSKAYLHSYFMRDAVAGLAPEELQKVGAAFLVNSSQGAPGSNNAYRIDLNVTTFVKKVAREQQWLEDDLERVLGMVPRELERVLPQIPVLVASKDINKGTEIRWKYAWK